MDSGNIDEFFGHDQKPGVELRGGVNRLSDKCGKYGVIYLDGRFLELWGSGVVHRIDTAGLLDVTENPTFRSFRRYRGFADLLCNIFPDYATDERIVPKKMGVSLTNMNFLLTCAGVSRFHEKETKTIIQKVTIRVCFSLTSDNRWEDKSSLTVFCPRSSLVSRNQARISAFVL